MRRTTTVYVCDSCGKEMGERPHRSPIRVEARLVEHKQRINYEVCSWDCLRALKPKAKLARS